MRWFLGISAAALLVAACSGMTVRWRHSIEPAYHYSTFRYHGSKDAIWIQAQNVPAQTDAGNVGEQLTEIAKANSRLHGLNVDTVRESDSSPEKLPARLVFRLFPDETKLADAACTKEGAAQAPVSQGDQITMLTVYCKRDQAMSSVWSRLPPGQGIDSDAFRKMAQISLYAILPTKNPALQDDCRPGYMLHC